MAREVVDGADVGAHRAEVGADRIHIVDAAEFTAIEVGLEMEDAGVVEEDVADHEHAALGEGEGGELGAFGGGGGEGFFAEDVLAGGERGLHEGEVRARGRGDDDDVDVGGVGDFGGVFGDGDAAEEFLGGGEAGVGGVAHAEDVAAVELAEVAHVVGAPLPEGDDADADGGRRGAHERQKHRRTRGLSREKSRRVLRITEFLWAEGPHPIGAGDGAFEGRAEVVGAEAVHENCIGDERVVGAGLEIFREAAEAELVEFRIVVRGGRGRCARSSGSSSSREKRRDFVRLDFFS